jgi:hypothetical protein
MAFPLKPRNPIINWGHPLTKGLVFTVPLSMGGGTSPTELVSRAKCSFAGTPNPTWKNSLVGKCLDFTGTSTAGEAVYFTPNSYARGLTKYSIEQLLMFRSAGAGSVATSFRVTDNTNSMNTIRVFDVNANSLLFTHFWTTTSGAWRVTGLTTNTIYHIVVTYDGSSSSNVPVMYVNGVRSTLTLVTNPSGTINNTFDSQFILGNINQTGNVGNRTWDGQIYKTSYYNRILSDQEAIQLYKNPWQIYGTPPTPKYLTALANNYIRNIVDTISATDSASRQVNYFRAPSDSILVTDSSRRVVSFNKNLSDSISITDFLSRISSMGRKVLDTTNVSDSATRTYMSQRAISDPTYLSDAISYITSTQVTQHNDPAPTIEAIVIQPMIDIDPSRMIVYTLATQPDSELVFKLYDSHTIYNKHIPYYTGRSSDRPPTPYF